MFEWQLYEAFQVFLYLYINLTLNPKSGFLCLSTMDISALKDRRGVLEKCKSDCLRKPKLY